MSNSSVYAGYKDAYLAPASQPYGRTHSSDNRRAEALKDPHTQAMLQQHTAALDLWLGLSVTPNVAASSGASRMAQDALAGETFSDRIAAASDKIAMNQAPAGPRQASSSLPRYIETDFYSSTGVDKGSEGMEWLNRPSHDLLATGPAANGGRRNSGSFGLGGGNTVPVQFNGVEDSPRLAQPAARKVARGFGPAAAAGPTPGAQMDATNAFPQSPPHSNKAEVVKQRLRGAGGQPEMAIPANGPAAFRAMWRAAADGSGTNGVPLHTNTGYYHKQPPPASGQGAATSSSVPADFRQGFHQGSMYDYYAATHHIGAVHATGSMTVSESSDERGGAAPHLHQQQQQPPNRSHVNQSPQPMPGHSSHYSHNYQEQPAQQPSSGDSHREHNREGQHSFDAQQQPSPLRPPYGAVSRTEHSDNYQTYHEDRTASASEGINSEAPPARGFGGNKFLSGGASGVRASVPSNDEESRVGALLASPPSSTIRAIVARSGIASSSPWGRQLQGNPIEQGLVSSGPTPTQLDGNRQATGPHSRASPILAQQQQQIPVAHDYADRAQQTSAIAQSVATPYYSPSRRSPSRHSIVEASFRATPTISGMEGTVGPSASSRPYQQSPALVVLDAQQQQQQQQQQPQPNGDIHHRGEGMHPGAYDQDGQGYYSPAAAVGPHGLYRQDYQGGYYPADRYDGQPSDYHAYGADSHQVYADPYYGNMVGQPHPMAYQGGERYEPYYDEQPEYYPQEQHQQQQQQQHPYWSGEAQGEAMNQEANYHPSYYGITGGAEDAALQAVAADEEARQIRQQYPPYNTYHHQQAYPQAYDDAPHVVATYSSPKRVVAFGELPSPATAQAAAAPNSTKALMTPQVSSAPGSRPPLYTPSVTGVGSPLPMPNAHLNAHLNVSPTPTTELFAAQVDAVMASMVANETSVASVLSQRSQQHKSPSPSRRDSSSIKLDRLPPSAPAATRSYLPTPNAYDLMNAPTIQDGGTQTTPLSLLLDSPPAATAQPAAQALEVQTVSTQVTPQSSSLRDMARARERSSSTRPAPIVTSAHATPTASATNLSRPNLQRPPPVMVDSSNSARATPSVQPQPSATRAAVEKAPVHGFDHTTQTDPHMGRHLVSTGVGARTPSLLQPTYSGKSVNASIEQQQLRQQVFSDRAQPTISSLPAEALADPAAKVTSSYKPSGASAYAPSLVGAIGVITPQPSNLSQRGAPGRQSAGIVAQPESESISTPAPIKSSNADTISALQKKLAHLVKEQEGLHQSNEDARHAYLIAAKEKSDAEAEASREAAVFRSQAGQLEVLLERKAEVLNKLKEENRLLRERARAARGL